MPNILSLFSHCFRRQFSVWNLSQEISPIFIYVYISYKLHLFVVLMYLDKIGTIVVLNFTFLCPFVCLSTYITVSCGNDWWLCLILWTSESKVVLNPWNSNRQCLLLTCPYLHISQTVTVLTLPLEMKDFTVLEKVCKHCTSCDRVRCYQVLEI